MPFSSPGRLFCQVQVVWRHRVLDLGAEVIPLPRAKKQKAAALPQEGPSFDYFICQTMMCRVQQKKKVKQSDEETLHHVCRWHVCLGLEKH
jgi:hypothetical protein